MLNKISIYLILLLTPYMVVATDANEMWQQLIKRDGCLASATDINYTITGSVFELKTWKDFFHSLRLDNDIFNLIIDKFDSRKATNIHICNFRNASEGEVAVFAAQHIVGKNWYSYDGNNCELKKIAQTNVASKALLLKLVLENKEMCKELQNYFKKQFILKQKKEYIFENEKI